MGKGTDAFHKQEGINIFTYPLIFKYSFLLIFYFIDHYDALYGTVYLQQVH